MDDYHGQYYALVWNTFLNSKKNLEIKGEKITKSTELPKDPCMLYGTNDNDVAKIRKVESWTEIEYDVHTTSQRVKFWKEVEEYIISRDVYILVWEGSEILSLPNDPYRIVTPDLFDYLVSTARETETVVGKQNMIKETLDSFMKNTFVPKRELEEFHVVRGEPGKIRVQLVTY